MVTYYKVAMEIIIFIFRSKEFSNLGGGASSMAQAQGQYIQDEWGALSKSDHMPQKDSEEKKCFTQRRGTGETQFLIYYWLLYSHLAIEKGVQ